MQDNKEGDFLEKGFSKIVELRIKIHDERYIRHATEKIAEQLCEGMFKRR